MAREFRWLAAIHPVFPLAPRPYLLCEDDTIVGSIFYVMERRRGVVVRHEEPLALVDQPALRRRVGEALVDTLADLHAIDISQPPLAGLGRPGGFVERQVRGWTDRWHRSKIAEVPEMEQLAGWLVAHLPPDPDRPAVVHGDFKLDNVLLDPADLGRIVAVFDWDDALESARRPRHPARLLGAHRATSQRDAHGDSLPGSHTTDLRATRQIGRNVGSRSNVLFKIAVVIQQIFYRYSRGQTDDARFATFGARVDYLAKQAWGLAQGT
jgi:hypothetical protein